MAELLPPRAFPATSPDRIFLMGAVVAVLGAHLDLEQHHLTVAAGPLPTIALKHRRHPCSMTFRVNHDATELRVMGKLRAWQAVEGDIANILSSYIEQIEEKDRNVDTEREPGGAGADEGP